MIPDDLLDGISSLEPMPVTIQKLLTVLKGDDFDLREVVQIIEYDGAITSNLLRMANSAAYRGVREIATVQEALVRIGSSSLINTMLVGFVGSLGSRAAPLFELTENELWMHGTAASLAVKAMIEEGGRSRIPPSSGLAALLHDIGKLIMVRFLKCDVSALRALCKEKDIEFIEAERELFGCDHAEVGGAVARKWNFPEEISEAIERHHQGAGDQNPMLEAVMLANLIAKSICIGLGADGMDLHMDFLNTLKHLGLNIEKFEHACLHTESWLTDVMRVFGLSRASFQAA
jgi:putative nucleotidyltransferase with HDIG domain